MIQDPAEPNLIFVGTEHGLWVSLDNGTSFGQWKNNFPSVSTFDLAIQEREADLAIGTFGRAIWILDDIRPLRKLAANKGVLTANRLTAFPAPDAYQASYRPAPGYEWSTMGIYDGDNRRRGAAISYFINKSKADTSKAKSDSLTVRIYNDKNELIRNLKWRADSGFNRQYWGMEERGVRNPGSPKPRPNAPEPGGLQVFPGTYKVVLSLGKDSDSTMVTIKDDPKLKKSTEVIVAQRNMISRLRKSSGKLTDGLDRLTEWEEVLTKVQGQLRGLEGKDVDSLRKTTSLLQDSIKAIRHFISGTPSEKQGIVRGQDYTVIESLQTAQQYTMSKTVAPSKQEESLAIAGEGMVNEAIRRINNFYETKWKPYRKHVEGTKVPLFKEYAPIQ
jgi:hypothetical protein